MALTEPEPDDAAPWTEATRARLAMSAAAMELADLAAGFVPIGPDELTTAGTQHRPHQAAALLEDAVRVRAAAERFLESAVVYESVSGASWGMIGDALGVQKQPAHRKYAWAVSSFESALADPVGVDEDTGAAYERRPEGADRPEEWAPRLDAWFRARRSPTDPHQQDNPVSGGMKRLHPHLELMRLQKRHMRLLDEHLVPPADLVLPIAERQLQLWQQMAQAGHDVAEQIDRLRRQIAELRDTHPESALDPERP